MKQRAACLLFIAATFGATSALDPPGRLSGTAALADDGQTATAGHSTTGRAQTGAAPADAPGEHSATVDYWSMLFVFVLSTMIGLGVIGRVSRLLHTPLMSLTNAISAIAVVGSIVVTGSDYPTSIRMLGAIALFASTTNIVSGFLITDRMLKMFKETRRPVTK